MREQEKMLTEKELGERLKNIRKMRNISQFRMADMMGTEQSTIAKFEKGASYPKVSTLYRYAECVGLTLSDILAESPPAKKGMLSPEEIGENIKKWSALRGMSIKGLAEKAGLSRSSILNLREGRCISYMPTYQYIAEALHGLPTHGVHVLCVRRSS
jgi:transcriptional regulator with XRE-family HTH domain